MEEKFRQWLIRRGNSGAATNYPSAIPKISRHYSQQTGKPTNIYKIQDQGLLSQITQDYKQEGKFSNFGYEHHGRYRAAIVRYSEFFVGQNDLVASEEFEAIEEILDQQNDTEQINFAYERDLQTTLCTQIGELFPNYKIYGQNNLGIEYSIENRRIDVLLEHTENGSLLAVELKSGVADYKVFGQVSMYIGALQKKFPDVPVSGVIVAGSIDESLRQASAITDKVKLKIYRMSLELDDE